MSLTMRSAAVAVAMALVACVQPALAQRDFDKWKISPSADGKAASMAYANPATYLKIESDLQMTVDAGGTATSGTIHFTNGFQRSMTPGEVAFYWSEFKGDIAYWDFRQAQGSIASFTSGTDPIPQNFVGQQVRVISNAGKFYIGILAMVPGSPDWFSLNIKNSLVLFYRNAVKEIQLLK